MASSVWERAGHAFSQGAPAGASVTIGQTTQDNGQANAAGRMFSQARLTENGYQPGSAFFKPQTFEQPTLAQRMATAQAGPVQSDGKSTGAVFGEAGLNLLHVMAAPFQGVADYYKSVQRLTSQELHDDDSEWWRGFLSSTAYWIPGVGFADPAFRDVWDDDDSRKGSVFQTLERATVGGGDFDLLDNPYRAAEAQAYYSSGRMRFTVGVADAAFNIFADPLVVMGGGISKIRQANRALSATDVAAIADRTIDTARLTSKQRQGRKLLDVLVDATEPDALTNGTVSALANTKFLAQSTDAGSIAYLLGRANSMADFAGDAAARKLFKLDVLHAGMGDQAALTRVGERSKIMQAELYRIGEDVSDARFANELAKPDVDMDSLFNEMHTEPGWMRSMEAQRADIEKQFEALQRVKRIGDPADTGRQGVGGLSTLPSGQIRGAVRTAQRDLVRQHSVIQSGRFLDPVNVMTGIHVPQTARLSADDFPQVFDAALRRANGVVDPSTLNKLRDDMYATIAYGQNTKVDRAAVLQRFNAAVEAGLTRKHGKSADQISTLMREARKRRGAELNSLVSRAYQAKPGERLFHRTPDGTFAYTDEAAQEIRKAGGVVDLDKPVLASQMEDWVSLLDTRQIDRFIGRQSAGGWEGQFARGADGLWHVTETLLTSANHLWKFAALFRLAYPARVQIDSQARLLASLGPMEYAITAAKGTRHTLYNRFAKVDRAVLKDYTKRFRWAERLDKIDRELASWGSPSIPRETLLSERDKLIQLLDTPSKVKLTGRKVRVKGTEMQRLLGKRQLDPKTGRLTGGIDDPYGSLAEFVEVQSKMDARANIVGLMSEGEGKLLRELRGTRNWDMIAGDNPQWADTYLRAVNRQVRNDQVGQMILAGRTDDEILRWLDTTAEGRSYWRAMAPTWSHEPSARNVAAFGELGRDEWLAAARQHVDTLVPNQQARELVSRTSLSRGDLQKVWPVPSERPVVPGEILEAQLPATASAGELYRRTQEQWFRFANDVPEQMMARHPFYASSFKGHMRELVRNTGVDDSALSLRQVNELRRQASILARRDVGKVMFDTSKQTNLGYHMRFMSPFYAAWWDTMTKWSRIMGSNLAIPPIALKVFAAPNAAGLVVDKDGRLIRSNGEVVDLRTDENGNTVGTGEVVGHANIFDEGTIVLPLPSWFEKATGQSDALISKGSLNVIFQGDPFWLPSPGPLVQVPVNEVLVRTFPEVGPRWANSAVGQYLTSGFGLNDESIGAQVLPTWVKNLNLAVTQNQSDPRFSQAYVLEYQSLLAEIDQGKREPMELDELQQAAATRTRNKFVMQFFGSWGVPVSTRTEGRLQFYLDTYREYQRQFGLDAYDRFSQDYPEYTELAISLSANETGLNATLPAWESVQAYRDAMARNPEFAWAFAGAANLLGEFDSNVYTLQRGTPIGDGTTKTFRSSKDPMESIRQNAVTQGWNDYWKVADALSSALDAAGLNSINAKGAEALKAAKATYIQQLSESNPAWGDAYNSGNSGDTAIRFMSWAAEQVEKYPELGDRSDFQTLFQYIQVRAAMQGALDSIGVRSINSQAAQDAGLTDAWNSYTAGLVQADIGFGQMWHLARLDADDLTGSVY